MALSKIVENSLADEAVSSAKLKDFSAAVDLNGVELVLDADADTSITADTDDRIDFKIAGVEHFSFSNSSGDTIIKPMVDAKDIKFQQYDGRTLLDINDGGFIGIANGATGPGTIRIFEDTDNGSNYVGLAAGSISSSLTFTLPTADGSSGQFLKTDGSGALSFDTVSSAADDLTTGDAAVTLATSAGNITIDAQGGDTDIIFKGTDGSSDITALTLDMSDAGKAIFNNAITSGAVITSGAGLVIADAGNIGSASDTDAIAIGSDGDVTLTQDLELQHDGAILSFGANDEVTLTHVHDTGILLNSTNVIQFNDASQNIGAPSATVLDINATDEIELNATLVDVNANLDVSGTYTGAGLMTTGGNIVIPDAGNIGSASDTDAIAIASNGATTFSQAASFSSTIGSSGAITATVAGTGLKSVGTNAQIHADANSGYGALIADGAASNSSYIFFQTDGTDKGRITVDQNGNFEIGSGGTTTGLKVDSSGHVTMPLQSCFFAHSNTASGVGTGTSDINNANERFDLNSDFNTSNGTFTAPVTGKYLFNVSVLVVNAQAGGNISIYLQPSNFEIRAHRQNSDSATEGTYESKTFSVIVDMDANDTCKVQINSSSDNDFIVEGGSYATTFSGHLVA